jgi:hypothetical protein
VTNAIKLVFSKGDVLQSFDALFGSRTTSLICLPTNVFVRSDIHSARFIKGFMTLIILSYQIQI